jgi:hypothetical protein
MTGGTMAATKISLIPSDLDLELYAGDGVELVIGLNDTSGAPLNVTGAVMAQIRVKNSDLTAAADFMADLTEGSTGKVILSLTGVQTAGLVQGDQEFTGLWDMQWTINGGEPVTVLKGKVKCAPDVTR